MCVWGRGWKVALFFIPYSSEPGMKAGLNENEKVGVGLTDENRHKWSIWLDCFRKQKCCVESDD